jgi:hypothetical protein
MDETESKKRSGGGSKVDCLVECIVGVLLAGLELAGKWILSRLYQG